MCAFLDDSMSSSRLRTLKRVKELGDTECQHASVLTPGCVNSGTCFISNICPESWNESHPVVSLSGQYLKPFLQNK